MTKLPTLSQRKVVKLFLSEGFEIKQGKKHVVAIKDDVVVPIPRNYKEIASGTLMSIIRLSGMTKEEFLSKINNL